MSTSTTMAGAEPLPSAGAYVGFNAVVQIAGEEIARVDRVRFQINNNVRQVFVVSSRTPLNVEQQTVYKGNIRRLYVNTALLRLVLGRTPTEVNPHGVTTTKDTIAGWMNEDDSTPSFASPSDFRRLPEVTIQCLFNIADVSGTKAHSITFNGVKFNTFDMMVSANDVVLENLDFFAEGVTVSKFT